MSTPGPFRRRLARNTAASVASNVWSMLLGLAALPLVLSGLGTDGFGVWVFLQIFSATTGWLSISSVGLATSATRAIAEGSGEDFEATQARLRGSIFAIFVAAGLVLGGLLAVVLPSLVQASLSFDVEQFPVEAASRLFGLQIFAEHVGLAVTSTLEGEQRVALARAIDAGRKTAIAVATVIAATWFGTLSAVAAASACAASLVVATALISLRVSGSLEVCRPSRVGIIEVARYGATVSALAGTGVLHRTMDRTIAGVAFGPSAVALVEIANQVQLGATALLSASTYPVVSSAPMLKAAGDLEALRQLFHRMTRYSVLLSVPMCALAVVLADPFIRSWVGAEYAEAVGLTQVALLSVVLAAPLQVGSNMLQGIGRAGSVLRASIASVAVNLAASLALVEVVGLVGVFAGTVVGAMVLAPVLVRPVQDAVGENAGAILASAATRAVAVAALTAIGGGVVLLTDLSPVLRLMIGGLLGLLVAAASALRFGLAAEERRELRVLLSR